MGGWPEALCLALEELVMTAGYPEGFCDGDFLLDLSGLACV